MLRCCFVQIPFKAVLLDHPAPSAREGKLFRGWAFQIFCHLLSFSLKFLFPIVVILRFWSRLTGRAALQVTRDMCSWHYLGLLCLMQKVTFHQRKSPSGKLELVALEKALRLDSVLVELNITTRGHSSAVFGAWLGWFNLWRKHTFCSWDNQCEHKTGGRGWWN